jgi:hypothetical protein
MLRTRRRVGNSLCGATLPPQITHDTRELEYFVMTYKATFVAVALAAASLGFGGSAGAAPLGNTTVNTEHTQLQKVHYRNYRHCHWRNGRRWCHGGYRRGYRGNYGPGISLYIGPRWGWGRRHHRRHWRRW